jgi:hypothetical protein
VRDAIGPAALLLAALSASCAGVAPTDASPEEAGVVMQAVSTAAEGTGSTFPGVIPLPNGWQPEGIVAAHGTSFYAGSLAGAGIYRGDFRTACRWAREGGCPDRPASRP